ncbi:MAG: flagellar hook-length control protein FliK, partial [Comamonas sp.]
MAETRIDTPRSAEPRAAKATAQAMTSVKSTLAAGDEAPAFSSLLAALDSFAATGLPQVALPLGEAQEEKTTLPALAEQETLLVAQGHAPWMSLVGQTARLDTQGDDDMRQGAATDFLSGRGNVTQLAHR